MLPWPFTSGSTPAAPAGSSRTSRRLPTTDGDDRLFVGRLRDPPLGLPTFQPAAFSYLDAVSVAAIESRLEAALRSILASIRPPVPVGADPRAVALQRFGAIVVSVDASSGFASPGNGRRNTEAAVASNFNTPDEATFVASALAWLAQGNITPLNQRVYWKLVGFVIFRYFTGAATAAQVAASASQGIGPNFTLPPAQPVGVRIYESFPSETYATTGPAALALAQAFAARTLVNIPAAPIHATTFAAFAARLQNVVLNAPGAWARSPGRAVGDCLDAYASMMLGPWAGNVGLMARGAQIPLLAAEGAIVVPQ